MLRSPIDSIHGVFVAPSNMRPLPLSPGEEVSYAADAVVFAIGIGGMQKLVTACPTLAAASEFRAVMNLKSLDVIATRLWLDRKVNTRCVWGGRAGTTARVGGVGIVGWCGGVRQRQGQKVGGVCYRWAGEERQQGGEGATRQGGAEQDGRMEIRGSTCSTDCPYPFIDQMSVCALCRYPANVLSGFEPTAGAGATYFHLNDLQVRDLCEIEGGPYMQVWDLRERVGLECRDRNCVGLSLPICIDSPPRTSRYRDKGV